MNRNSFLRLFRSQWLLIILLVTALAAFGCESDDDEDAAGADGATGASAAGGAASTMAAITVQPDGTFNPNTLTVAVGTVVTITNNSTADVQLRIAQGATQIDSRVVSSGGGTFTWAAPAAGEYTLNDENNTGTTGAMTTITVQ